MSEELSAAERKAIRTLENLAESWPKTLWLYSASGTLNVMRVNEDGQRAYTPGGGVDPDYIVADIEIPNDGGDW